MLFKPDLCAKVLAGEKTQTRRPVKWAAGALVSVEPPIPCQYRVGRDYAVQPGRGQKAVGRIRVLEVARVCVESIDGWDAVAEGFESRAAFLDWWRGFYGTVQGECWRIRFVLA